MYKTLRQTMKLAVAPHRVRARSFVLAAVACSTLGLSTAVQAGTVTFYKKDNGQEPVGVSKSTTSLEENLTKSSVAPNDDIRSVRFENVEEGLVLELWDDSNQRGNDDWCRITIEEAGSYLVGNIEQDPNVPGLKYERHAKDKDEAKRKYGNLAGKVSHIRMSGDKLVMAITREVEEIYAWGFKNGRAQEFNRSDSNFRVWQPTIRRAGNGVSAVFKMDHIRGSAADDHASVTMQFDERGVLASETVEIQFAGKNPIIKVLEARNELTEELAAAVDNPKAKAALLVAAAAGKLQTAIAEAIEEASEKGGRLLFPGAIQQTNLEIGTKIADTLANL